MTAITSYLYPNKFVVQIIDNDPAITTRNHVVYQRPIEIYRGADNPITIYFKNQDQKPANISSLGFQGYIVDKMYGNVISNVTVTVSNVTLSTASCVLTSDFVNMLPQNQYLLAFTYYDGTYNVPVYSDDNYQVYAQLNINQAFATNPFTTSTTDFTGNLDLGMI